MGWCGASGVVARLGLAYSHRCSKVVFGLACVARASRAEAWERKHGVAHGVSLGVEGTQGHSGGQEYG